MKMISNIFYRILHADLLPILSKEEERRDEKRRKERIKENG